jgi:cytochrome P450
MEQQMEFNPFSPEFHADPYPSYAQLRREAPVLRMDSANTAVITRYDDVVQVLKSPNLFSSRAIGMQLRGRPTRTVINTDPPVHTELRGLINRAFTPRMVADLEPRIREITTDLIDAIVEKGETDLVRDLAVPLPVTVIAELLGVEPERHDDFKRWSTAAVTQERDLGDDGQRQLERDIDEFASYFERAIDERRGRPGTDLISAVLAAEQSDLQLTPDDLVAFAGLLLIAGNETTTNLIGNAVLALLEHPHQLAKVRADRALIPNMVRCSSCSARRRRTPRSRARRSMKG